MVVDQDTGGAVPHFHGNELLKLIPEIDEQAQVEMLEFGMYPGPHMTPDLIFELAGKINDIVKREDINGVIVTHGTDTLEESSYLVDLVVKTEKPIVFIGSMKTSSEPDWDGPRNLMDAVYICQNPNSRGLGVLVCLDGEINAASEVTKTHTEDNETFHSLDFGALGFVDRGRVFFNRAPRKLECVQTDKLNSNVHLIKTYVGMDERQFKFSADCRIDGLVVEAMGVGNVPPPAFEGIKYVLDKGIPVVLVSRCPAGETLDVYGYPGAGKWLKKAGVIFADYLNGQKARVKLMLCLGKTTDRDELEKLFEELP